MIPPPDSRRSGQSLLKQCPSTTRARVDALLRLERLPDPDPTLLVVPLVQLVEHELVRLLLDPLRPWGETLASILAEEKSGRRAADTLRIWSEGGEVHNVAAFASRVFQALRKGCRAKDPRVATLVAVFFSPELQSRVAKPQLGLTLERIRTRFRDPIAHESGVFTRDEYQDLVHNVFATDLVTPWYEEGPGDEGPGLLDQLLRGTRLHTSPPPGQRVLVPGSSARGELAETAIEPEPPRTEVLVEGGRLGQYDLLGELGRGGMGVVFKGWDSSLGRQVAIKVLKGAVDPACPEVLERFGREARSVARLQHENIVVVHEVVELVEQPYLVMQYVEGQTLEDWLLHEPSPREVVGVARQVALALHYAHEQGVVHRDVKPTNIMIDSQGRPILMDFGLALDLTFRTRLTATGQIIGTPRYMAPEQIEGDPQAIGVASDVYSLGAVLYRGLCGRAPFEASSPTVLFKQVLLDEPAPPRSVNPSVSAVLEAVVLRCLAKDPAQRYSSAAALAQDLEGEA